MRYYKKLGIFVKIPVPGEVKTRLVPPLSPEEACELYRAFLADLFTRISKLKKISGTVFYSGADPAAIEGMVPPRYRLMPQTGDTLGERLQNAFEALLEDEGSSACVIGSDSPDIPLAYLKRAFLKLKRKDIVLGPAADGGYYLIALKKIIPELFRDIDWGTDTVFGATLRKVDAGGLSSALLPLWYDVDDVKSLSLLENILFAKRMERSDRLQHIERVIEKIRSREQ